ncbi:MAG: hypothetical protein ABR613_06765 [Actinomycetota bacterium]
MSADDEVVRLLGSIDRRLALLTGAHERDLRRALEDELLRTEGRIAVFNKIDGRRGAPELAKETGVGIRAAQLFVKELLEAGLVRDTHSGTGRTIVIERDEDAIVQWYVSREGKPDR